MLFGIDRVGASIGRAHARQARSKLVHIGLAQEERTSIQKTLHHGRSLGGLVSKGSAARCGLVLLEILSCARRH